MTIMKEEWSRGGRRWVGGWWKKEEGKDIGGGEGGDKSDRNTDRGSQKKEGQVSDSVAGTPMVLTAMDSCEEGVRRIEAASC